MSFFKKMKTFLGAEKPEILFSRLEESIPITDTGVKYRLAVNSKSPLTVMSVTGSLKAVYRDGEGVKKELLLKERKDDGSSWIASQNPFPGKLSPNSSWRYGGMVFMSKQKNRDLQALYANKFENQLQLILKVELDIKETGMLFDPSVEREIELQDANRMNA